VKRVTIKIEGKEYDINLKSDFADALEVELAKELPPFENNAIKDLLQAYLKKCYDCYLIEQKLQKLLKKLSD